MTSSPHNPDDRDLLDFADAVAAGENPHPQTDQERTYLHVHHAMQGEHGAIPSDTKQSTWEDVMSTLAIAPETPVSNRTKRQQALTSPRRVSRPKSIQWTPMASVAAVVLVVLASIGIWRINTMPSESLPPLAPQVAGIVSGDDVAQVAATPDATAVVDESGNISIPIVQHVDEQPFDGPVIWLTTGAGGDVLYDDGTGEVTTIATDAFQVSAQTTNVIKVLTHAPEKDSTDKEGNKLDGYTVTYHHLISGKTLVDDGTFSSYLGGPNTFGSLQVLTISDAPREWSIVNFETMESKSISELTGGKYRSSESITVAVSDDFSTIAIGTSQYESEAAATLMKPSGMPGEVAIIPADLSTANWVSVPEGMTSVGNISLSPDGSKIAFIAQDSLNLNSSITVSVVDIESNEELTRTEQIESSMIGHFMWLPTSDAFVLLTDTSVQRFDVDGSESTVLFESDGVIDQMPNMTGSDMIYLRVWSASEGIFSPDPESSQLVILNPVTGDTIKVDGNPWFRGGSSPVTFTTTLAPIPVSQDGKTAALVHPITGEAYPDLAADVYDPLLDPEVEFEPGDSIPFVMTVVTAATANTSVVTLADGNLAIFHTKEDLMDAVVVESPAPDISKQLLLSPSGTHLIVGGAWEGQTEDESFMVLDLTDPNAEWVQGEPGQRIDFVELNEP